MVNKIKNLFSSEIGNKIFSTIENTISAHNMKERIESGVLVGFSGGPDSVMLLCFLMEYRKRFGSFPILLCHINHCIRGIEADRDENFSKEMAASLNLECISKRIDIPSISKEKKTGMEEMAREARYSEFREILSGRNDISYIATAHNATDNLETVVFNILRGAGTRGAAGIPPVRDNIIRPLIGVSKEDILCALNEFDIPYVLDSTNISTDYTRNFLRNKVLPLFKDVTPFPERNVNRLSKNLRGDDEYLYSVADKFIRENSPTKTGELSKLHRSILYRVLAKMAEPYGISLSEKHIESIEGLLTKDNFRVSLPGSLTFVSENGISYITDAGDTEIDYRYFVETGKTGVPEYGAEIYLGKHPVDKTFLNVHKNSIQADISSAIIVGRLYIRPKKDGDSVFYGGMTHKLKKLFNDRKIPVSLRPLIPILCDEKGVVWVPGFGLRDDGIKRDDSDSKYIALVINDADSPVRFHIGTEFK